MPGAGAAGRPVPTATAPEGPGRPHEPWGWGSPGPLRPAVLTPSPNTLLSLLLPLALCVRPRYVGPARPASAPAPARALPQVPPPGAPAVPRPGTKLLCLALRHPGLWGQELTKDPLSPYLAALGQESRKHLSLAQTVSFGRAQPIAPPAKDNAAHAGAAERDLLPAAPRDRSRCRPSESWEPLRAPSSAAACRGQWRGAVAAVAGSARTTNPPLKRHTEFGGLYLVASAHSRSCQELCV